MDLAFKEETEIFILEAKSSEDKLKLFVDITKKSDTVPDRLDLLRVLEKHIPADHLHKGVLKSILEALKGSEKVEGRRIAKGVAPVKGDDGKFLALVKDFSLRRESETPGTGSQGLRNRQVFENIEVGTIVGRVYPPKEGTDGVDVFGKKISAVGGQETKIQLDSASLELVSPTDSSKVYKEVRAKVEGYLENRSGDLRIVEELVVAEDVDFHFGNINFIGRVIVKGMVKPGFQVIAKKGIEVHGNMIRGVLLCPEADILVRGLVIGRKGDPAKVVCGGELSILGASNALFEVKGDMKVAKELRDCVVRCGQTLYATSASIVGGKVLAVCGVDAKVLGSNVGVRTKVYLTSDVEMSADYKVLRHEIERHERAEILLTSHLGQLRQHPEQVERLAEPHRGNMKKMLQKLLSIEKSKAKLLRKKAELLAQAKHSASSRVNFHKIMYSGVEVFSADLEYLCKEDTKGPKAVVYQPEGESLTIGEIGPLECVWVEKGAQHE